MQRTSNGLINFFVHHAVAANLVMASMIFFGAYGIAKMNTQFFPNIITDRITVSVGWSGASAEDVDESVIAVIEPAVRYLEQVDNVSSYAREGVGTVVIEYEEGTDMAPAMSDMEQAIAGIGNLPEGAEVPNISQGGRFDRIARFALIGPFPESALKRFANDIRDDLINRGIDRVTFRGARDEEYLVNLRERDLRRAGLTVQDVSRAIGGNSKTRPSGNLPGWVEKQLRILSVGTSQSEISDQEAKILPTGESIQLKELGTVKKEFNSGQTRGFSEGNAAIEVTVFRALTADTLKTAKILEDYLEEREPTLPKSLKIVKYDVRSEVLSARIDLLVSNGLTGLVLVIIVLFVFLNGRIAIWVAAGIPVAVLCTLGIMWMFGQTINMISLFALIMMLGIIVDDAIVVGEHTATRTAMGDGPYEAAKMGAGKMFMPIIGAGLTTIGAFLPIFLVGDTIGQIMSVLPFVVICVVIASFIECFLVLPGHLAHSLAKEVKIQRWNWIRHLIIAGAIGLYCISLSGRAYIEVPPILDFLADPLRMMRQILGPFFFQVVILLISLGIAAIIEAIIEYIAKVNKSNTKNDEDPGWFRKNFDQGFNYLRDKPFQQLVKVSYRWRYLTIALCLSSVVLSFGLVQGKRVGFVFFPSPEAESISASISFIAGISEETTYNGIIAVEKALRTAEQKLTNGEGGLIAATFATIGESGRSRGSNFAAITVQLESSEFRQIRTPEIVRAWRAELPDISGLKRIAISERRGGPPGRDLDIKLQSGPPAVLKQAALEVEEALSAFPGVTGVNDNLPYGKPELVMELTPRGKALGFSVDSLSQQISSSFDGTIPRRFVEDGEEIRVRVRQELEESGAGALRSMFLLANNGEFVPLEEIVTFKERQGFSIIQREDSILSVSVTADVDYSITNNQLITAELNRTVMPELAAKYGIEYDFGGRAREQERSFSELQLGAFVAVILIYLLLAGIFADYWRAASVMAIIPFGVVGAIVGHYLMGYDLTILSLIGLLGLAGILVNNSIILMDRFVDRIRIGEPSGIAAVGASCDRLRAVILTSMTTIFGLMPLLFEQSIQAQFLKPMAITIVFGLGTSMIIVLFLVPSLIGVFKDFLVVFRTLYNIKSSSRPTENDLMVVEEVA